MHFERRDIFDRDRAGRFGLGAFSSDMPIGRDLVRARLALLSAGGRSVTISLTRS
jgi:hypothetical protein